MRRSGGMRAAGRTPLKKAVNAPELPDPPAQEASAYVRHRTVPKFHRG